MFTQLAWCRDHPRAAAAMARRALRRALETLSDEAVDAQAVRVLRAAAAQKGLLQVTDPKGTVAAPQRPRKTRTRDKAEL